MRAGRVRRAWLHLVLLAGLSSCRCNAEPPRGVTELPPANPPRGVTEETETLLPVLHPRGALRAVRTGDEVVVLGAEGAFAVRVAEDIGVSLRALPIQRVSLAESMQPTLAVVGGLVLQLQANALGVWRVLDGKALGHVELGDEARAASLSAAAENEALAVVRVAREQGKDLLVALRRADGTLVWRQAAVFGETTWGTADTLLSWDRDGKVSVLDPETGRLRWQKVVGSLAWVRSVEERVLAMGMDGTLVALHPGDGHEIARAHLLDGTVGSPVLGPHTTLFAAGVAVARGPAHCSTICALNAERMARLWCSVPACSLRDEGPVALVHAMDVVVSCGPDDVLRAYDVKTGALRGARGMRTCVDLAPARGSDVLAVGASDEATEAHAAVVSLALLERGTRALTVHGKVRSPRGEPVQTSVQVGDTVVQTDASGHYAASLVAGGTVYVQAAPLPGTMTARRPIATSVGGVVEQDLEVWPHEPERE